MSNETLVSRDRVKESSRDTICIRIHLLKDPGSGLSLHLCLVAFPDTKEGLKRDMKIVIKNGTPDKQLAKILPLPNNSAFLISDPEVQAARQGIRPVWIAFDVKMPGLTRETLQVLTPAGNILTTTLHARALPLAHPMSNTTFVKKIYNNR